MKRHVLLTALVASTLAFSGAALAQSTGTGKEQPKKETQPKTEKDHKDSKAHADKAKVGEKAPDFTLTDTDGKTWTLSELTKQKKIVVLEWFSPECPYSGVKHYKDNHTMQDTAKAYKDKGVVWLSINSNDNKTGTKERNAQAKKEWKIEHPILLDTTGAVAHAYEAKNTPTMYIITADGTLAYWGAIDNDPGTAPGKVNYVAKALDEILAGQTVTESKTKPYGCRVAAKEQKTDKTEKTEKGKKEEKK